MSNPALFAAGDATLRGHAVRRALGVLKKTPVQPRGTHEPADRARPSATTTTTSRPARRSPATRARCGRSATRNRGASDRDFVLFYNPNNAQAKVTLTIYPESGSNVLTSTITVDPNRQRLEPEQVHRPDQRQVRARSTATCRSSPPSRTTTSPTRPALPRSADQRRPDRRLHRRGRYGTNANRELVTILNANPQTATITLTLNYESGAYRLRTISAAANNVHDRRPRDAPRHHAGPAVLDRYESNRPMRDEPDLLRLRRGDQFGARLRRPRRSGSSAIFRPASGARIRDYLRIFSPPTPTRDRDRAQLQHRRERDVLPRTVRRGSPTSSISHGFVTGAKKERQQLLLDQGPVGRAASRRLLRPLRPPISAAGSGRWTPLGTLSSRPDPRDGSKLQPVPQCFRTIQRAASGRSLLSFQAATSIGAENARVRAYDRQLVLAGTPAERRAAGGRQGSTGFEGTVCF